MRVVTSGSAYLDIDAYACCIAYAELLNRQGVPACAASSAAPNFSLPATVLGWHARLDDHSPSPGDEFVLVDVSDYHHVDARVVLDQVVEVLDHHPGFEQFWAQRLGPAADIRPIGAAATLVFLRWEAAGLLSMISQASAALLATAILDNTLNFTGQMTTAQDWRAYAVLAPLANLAADWPGVYFAECQTAIESDLAGALAADTKRMAASSNLPQVFAQMTVWDAEGLVQRHQPAIVRWLAEQGETWVLNAISIREGKSYLLAGGLASQARLSRLLSMDWRDGMAVLEPSLQRKEIVTLGLGA
ncbi:MAG: DHH family protein [Pseudomonas sp.]|uniref:DHH family phosphoesterase n=1 Tax=Pseudomonas sp. TaxID=306 RepID=UPI003C76D62D